MAHHSSGDIGVSASLVLHGTPPFQVYYRSQRDAEPPQEKAKTFNTARGELTVQPDRSGHYTFKIHQVSDANYKKVELKGSAIELDVHPPPSADFAGNAHGARNKKSISSCSGSVVDVDVELRVSHMPYRSLNSSKLVCAGHCAVERRGTNRGSEGLGNRAFPQYSNCEEDTFLAHPEGH